MVGVLSEYEMITGENVVPGDLVVFSSVGSRLALRPIVEVSKAHNGSPMYRTQYAGGPLDSTFVLKQNGKVLIGKELYKRTLELR